ALPIWCRRSIGQRARRSGYPDAGGTYPGGAATQPHRAGRRGGFGATESGVPVGRQIRSNGGSGLRPRASAGSPPAAEGGGTGETGAGEKSQHEADLAPAERRRGFYQEFAENPGHATGSGTGSSVGAVSEAALKWRGLWETTKAIRQCWWPPGPCTWR